MRRWGGTETREDLRRGALIGFVHTEVVEVSVAL